jgi:hypothetical protein
LAAFIIPELMIVTREEKQGSNASELLGDFITVSSDCRRVRVLNAVQLVGSPDIYFKIFT